MTGGDGLDAAALAPRMLGPGDPGIAVTGGVTDPRSAHLMDIDAVHHASIRYRRHAEDIAGTARILAALAHEVAAAGAMGGPVPAIRRRLDAAALADLADDLDAQAEERIALAGRVTRAAMLYRDVDEEGATRFRRVLEGSFWDTGLPANPWVWQHEGRCSTTPRTADEEAHHAPACPLSAVERRRLEDLYPVQELELSTVVVVGTRAAPGVAGVLRAVHDAYAARTPDGSREADVIDVHKRIHRAPDGSLRESYLVALPGTSRWDRPGDPPDPDRHRSMRPNLEGVAGIASAEARLVPEVLVAAGVPDGAEVLLAGHSQGGMTAMSAAALPAMRRYRVQVLTAGSPVARSPVVPSVRYLHVVHRGDVVPVADRAPNRPTRNQVTVTTGPVRDPVSAHDPAAYVAELDEVDEARAAGRLPPALEDGLRSLHEAGHIRSAGGDDASVRTRVYVRART